MWNVERKKEDRYLLKNAIGNSKLYLPFVIPAQAHSNYLL